MLDTLIAIGAIVQDEDTEVNDVALYIFGTEHPLRKLCYTIGALFSPDSLSTICASPVQQFNQQCVVSTLPFWLCADEMITNIVTMHPFVGHPTKSTQVTVSLYSRDPFWSRNRPYCVRCVFTQVL